MNIFILIFINNINNINEVKKWGWGIAGITDFYNENILISSGSLIGLFTIDYQNISEYVFDDFVCDFLVKDSFLYVADDEKGIYKLRFFENQNFTLIDSLKLKDNSLRLNRFNDTIIIALSSSHIYSIDARLLNVIDSFFINGQPQEMFIKDTLLYVGCGYGGLTIFSLSNGVINQLGNYSQYIEYAGQTIVKDSICYMVNALQGFMVLNVKNPSNPVFIKNLNINDICADLILKDSLLYVLGYSTLKIFSLQNPVNPEFLKNYNYGGRRFNYKDTLMVISDILRFKMLNIKNPFSIYQISIKDASEMVYSFSYRDSIILSSHFFTGLNLFKDTLKYVINLKNAGFPIFTNLNNDYIYAVNYFGGIYVLDIYNLNVVKYFDLIGSENSIIFYDTLGFVACKDDGIRVINIKDINNIYEITSNTAKDVYNISNYKNYIYGVLGVEGIGIFQFLSDSLMYILTIPSINKTDNVMILDKYLLFNDGDSIIKIYDVSNPTSPSFISKITGIGCKNFNVIGDYIFTYNNNILKLFSLKDIYLPEKIGEISVYDEITSISTYPPFLYVGNKNIGIRVFLYDSFDIMPPRYPKRIFINNNEISEWSCKDTFLISFEHYFDDTMPSKILFKYSKPPFYKSDTSFTLDYKKINNVFPRREGIDTIYVWFEDSLGNVDYRLNKFFVLKYDTTKPIPPEPLFPLNNFISERDSFFFKKGVDSLSGVKNYIIQFDSIISFNSPILIDTITDTAYFYSNLPKNRIIYWRIFSVDSAGNISIPSTYASFYIDNQAPYNPESVYIDSSFIISSWKKDSVFLIEFKGYDISGISKVLLKEGSHPNFNFDTTASSDTFPFYYIYKKEGRDSVWIWLVDGVGNTDFNNTSFFIVRRDTTPPDTLYNLSIKPAKWSNKDTFTLRWEIPYDLSGIKRILFKIDSSPLSIYDTSFSIDFDTTLNYILDKDGIHHLYIWCEDSALNSSISKLNIATLKLDRIIPEIPTPFYPPDNSFLNENPCLKWQIPFDSISGIMGYIVNIDTTNLFTSSIYTETTYVESLILMNDLPINKFIFWNVSAFDSAFNVSYPSQSFSFYLDKIPPGKPESIFIDGDYLISKWKKDSIYTIRITESKSPSKSDTSGIDRILYKLGYRPFSNYDTTGSSNANPFNLIFNKEGIETLWIWLMDKAGNTDYKNSSFGIIKRDTTPPDTLTFLSIFPDDWTNRDTFIVKYKVPKDLSGIFNISLKLGQIPVNCYDTTLTSVISDSLKLYFSNEGVINTYFWISDSAGNYNFHSYQVRKIRRDTTKPVFHYVYYNDTLLRGDSLHITLQISDSVSGVKECFLKVKNYSLNNEFLRYFPVSNPEIKITPIEYSGNSSISIKISDYANNMNELQLDYYQYFDEIKVRDSLGNPVIFKKDKWFIISSPFQLDIKENFSYIGESGKDFKLMDLIDTNYINYDDSLLQGRGLFMKISNDNVIKFSKGYIKNMNYEYKIPLRKGWNIIGNPFMFPIKTNQFTFKNRPWDYIWIFNEDWILSKKIKPFEGGILYSEDSDTLFIYPDSLFNNENLLDLPYLKIEFFNDSVKDFSNYLILNHVDKQKWIREPPGMNSRVYFTINNIRYALVSVDSNNVFPFKLFCKERGNIRFILSDYNNNIYIIYKDVIYQLNDMVLLRDIEGEVLIICGNIDDYSNNLKDRILYSGGNIFRKRLNIDFFTGEMKEIEITIFDISGRILYKKKDYFNKGFNTIQTDISKSGIYLLKITDGKEKIIKKILLIR